MKVLVLFYSTYGHVYRVAQAIADGVREVPGVDAVIKRVPETLPPDVIKAMGATEAQKAFADVPVAVVNDLAEAGAVIFGTPTRFGNMAGQMRQFLDATGELWAQGKLVGKVGKRLHELSDPAWRPGVHHTELPHDAAPPRHGHRGIAIHVPRPDAHRRDHRRLAVRDIDDCRRQGRAHGERERARGRTIPGPTRGADREEVVGVARPV